MIQGKRSSPQSLQQGGTSLAEGVVVKGQWVPGAARFSEMAHHLPRHNPYPFQGMISWEIDNSYC